MEKIEGRKLSEAEVVQMLKNKHLLTAQKGTGQSAVDVSNYCEWNFTAAKTIFSKLHSDQVISEIVQKQEALKAYSCFNSLVKLEKLAQRPSCVASRRFIFQLIDDMLCHGILRDEDLSKKDIIGSGSNVGLIHLFEFKWRSLTYILDIMCVQAKLKDADRVLLKEHLRDPNSARENTVVRSGECELAGCFVKVVPGSLDLRSGCGLPEDLRQLDQASHEAQLPPGDSE